MARSLPVENLLAQNVGSIINNLQSFAEVAQWGAPSCSRPQLATDNGVRDSRSNWLVAPPTLHRAVPSELHVQYCTVQFGLQITRLAALSEPRTCDIRNSRPTHCLCCHSGSMNAIMVFIYLHIMMVFIYLPIMMVFIYLPIMMVFIYLPIIMVYIYTYPS